MRLVSWVRFTWNLRNLPAGGGNLPEQFQIRRAVKGEEKAVQKCILTAISLDSDWLDVPQQMYPRLENRVKEAFAQKEIPCLVLTHGTRIIGASIVNFEGDANNNLVSGPCILIEYRNRGLGTSLLFETLALLKAGGMEVVHGVTKKNGSGAKFVYPKFEGIGEEFDLEMELVS